MATERIAKDFYRSMHPDQFSDTTERKISTLTQEVFEFYLNQLTSNNKEKEFETFCKRIIEATICPNLLPQTGPTGGGDSKVDSETIPVAEEIAENWLYGFGDDAHVDRWAFAFSAKKDWKSKLTSDVKKIVGVNIEEERDYKKIFFVTNQSVSDKKRAEAEDALRKETHLDVRILDRLWLVETTFTNDNVNIAVDSFNMSDSYKVETEIGANDRMRKERLQFIEKELLKGDELKHSMRISYLAETVELSREQEIEYPSMLSILDRNIQQNQKYGTTDSIAMAYYDYCWTVLWWYNDIEEYYAKYKELEKIYISNQDRYHLLKKLSTLWINLSTRVCYEGLDINAFDSHTDLIHNGFKRFISDKENPKRALLARSDYQMIRMQNPAEWGDVLHDYESILDNMGLNNDIDIDTIQRIFELPILKDQTGYDSVFEKLVLKMGDKSRHISSAELLLNRGDDFTDNNPYQSIKYYSRAISQLYYEPVKSTLIQTYLRFGFVFQNVGLYWASRTFYVRAFMESMHYYFEDGFPSPGLFLAAKNLKYVELYLGRLEYSLHFNDLELIGRNIYPYNSEIADEELLNYDIWLSMAFLKEDYKKLYKFDRVPDYLEERELIWASAMLKFKLGHYDAEFLNALGGKEKFEGLVKDILNKDDFQLTPPLKDLSANSFVLSTTVIGCQIIVSAPRKSILLELASTLLSMVENMFATGVADNVFPFTNHLEVRIIIGNEIKEDIEIDYNNQEIILSVSNIDKLFSYSKRQYVADKLFEIIAYISVKILNNTYNQEKFKKSVEEENVMFRTTGISSTLDSFLVEEDYYLLPNEIQNYKRYELIRTTEIEFPEVKGKKENQEPDKIHFDIDKKHFNLADIKHSDIITSNLIDINLWDSASWNGVVCVMFPNPQLEPMLGFVFNNSSGFSIFKDWISKGSSEKISIGIIKGIDKKNPLWYRVTVGEDFFAKNNSTSKSSVITSINRNCTMNATTDIGQKTLEEILRISDRITILPVLKCDAQNITPFINKECQISISTKQVKMVQAEELSDSDFFLISGLLPSDSIVKTKSKKCFAEEAIEELRKMPGAISIL